MARRRARSGRSTRRGLQRRATLEKLEPRIVFSAGPLVPAEFASHQPWFERVEGDAGASSDHAAYIFQGNSSTARLTAHEMTVVRHAPSAGGGQAEITDVVNMRFDGARPDARIGGGSILTGTTHRIGAGGPAGVAPVSSTSPHFADLAIQDLYGGIDARYHITEDNHLELDFLVAPCTDTDVIELSFPNSTVTLSPNGTVHAGSSGQEGLSLAAPVAYQGVGDERVLVDAEYIVRDGGKIGIALGPYNLANPLVIDPVFDVSAASYLGGSSADEIRDMTVDDQGRVVVTGWTDSVNFPTTAGSIQQAVVQREAFIARFNSDLSQLEFVTVLGGSGNEEAHAIEVLTNGNLVVAGATSSLDFPLQSPLQSRVSGQDAFVAELSSGGDQLLFSTRVSGSAGESIWDLAASPDGAIHFGGGTTSDDLCVTSAIQSTPHGAHAGFFGSISADRSSWSQLSYLGGSDNPLEAIEGVEWVDDGGGGGELILAGTTSDNQFPTVNALQNQLNGSSDLFLSRVSANGSGLVDSTYYGTSLSEVAHALALDPVTRQPILVGRRGDVGTPAPLPNGDALLVRFASDGRSVIHEETIGGTALDEALAVATDARGFAYVAGVLHSGSFGFPIQDAFQPDPGGGSDAMVAIFDPLGNRRLASYYGGTSDEVATAIAVKGNGDVVVGGWSRSAGLATPGSAQSNLHGGNDGFVMQLIGPGRAALTPSQLDTLHTIARASVKLALSPEANNLAAGVPHSWFGIGPYRQCHGIDDCVEQDEDIPRGFGSHFVMNEATLRFNVLGSAYVHRDQWLDHLSSQEQFDSTWAQIQRGLDTIETLQTSPFDADRKFVNGAFFRTYATTPIGADHDLEPNEIIGDGHEHSSDDNGLPYLNLLVLRGMARDPSVALPEDFREKIVRTIDRIIDRIDLTRFLTPGGIALNIDPAGKPLSGQVWDRVAAEGALILGAMLHARQIDLAQFETLAQTLFSQPVVIDTYLRPDVSIRFPSFFGAMFMNGVRTVHGFPVTWEEYAGATFFNDSIKPLAEVQIDDAQANGYKILGSQVMTGDLDGYSLTRKPDAPGELARFAGNELDEKPVYDETKARMTATHSLILPLARFRELQPEDIEQLFAWIEAYMPDYFDPRYGFHAQVPFHPADATFGWTSGRDGEFKRSDAGVTFDVLNNSYTVLAIHDAISDMKIADYAPDRFGPIAAFLDNQVPITAELFDEPQILFATNDATVAEEGDTREFQLRLGSQPTESIVITVAGDDQLEISETTHLFTPEDWFVERTVGVTAKVDSLLEGEHQGTIALRVSTGDYYYDAIDPPNTVLAIGGDGSPWQSPRDDRDVNDDGVIDPRDVALLAAHLHLRGGAHRLPVPSSQFAPPPYLDVNGDLDLGPADVVRVVSWILLQS